jgi:hypothetical protein
MTESTTKQQRKSISDKNRSETVGELTIIITGLIIVDVITVIITITSSSVLSDHFTVNLNRRNFIDVHSVGIGRVEIGIAARTGTRDILAFGTLFRGFLGFGRRGRGRGTRRFGNTKVEDRKDRIKGHRYICSSGYSYVYYNCEEQWRH